MSDLANTNNNVQNMEMDSNQPQIPIPQPVEQAEPPVTLQMLAETIRNVQSNMLTPKDLMNYLRTAGRQTPPTFAISSLGGYEWGIHSLSDSGTESKGGPECFPPEFCALFESCNLRELDAHAELTNFKRAWHAACEGFARLATAGQLLQSQELVVPPDFMRAAQKFAVGETEVVSAQPTEVPTVEASKVDEEQAGVTAYAPIIEVAAPPTSDEVVNPRTQNAPLVIPLLVPLMKPPVGKPPAAQPKEHTKMKNPYEYIEIHLNREPKAWRVGWGRPDLEMWNVFWRYQNEYWRNLMGSGKVEETFFGYRIEGNFYLAWAQTDAWQWWWKVDEPWIGGYVHQWEIMVWHRDGVKPDEEVSKKWPLPIPYGPNVGRCIPWQRTQGVNPSSF